MMTHKNYVILVVVQWSTMSIACGGYRRFINPWSFDFDLKKKKEKEKSACFFFFFFFGLILGKAGKLKKLYLLENHEISQAYFLRPSLKWKYIVTFLLNLTIKLKTIQSAFGIQWNSHFNKGNLMILGFVMFF